MKKSKLMLLILGCAMLTLVSCRKEEPVPEDKTPVVPTPTDIPNDFFAEVDGDDYYETVFSGSKNDTMLMLSAPKGNEAIGLMMPLSIGVGTYTFDGFIGTKTAVYSSSSTSTYLAEAGTGTLTIIFHDKNTNVIRGSFSFTATPAPVAGNTATGSHNITNGTFTYNY